MSILGQLAHKQGRRDEVPNQELARALAAKKDRAGIAEIADHLWDEDNAMQADCIKVLYEIGFIDPSLVADFAEDFIRLLSSKNNRLVWGGTIALTTVAAVKADVLFQHRAEIERAVERGSVITQDNGVKALAIVASTSDALRRAIFPFLMKHLENCRMKDVPQRSEHIVIAVNKTNRDEFVALLKSCLPNMNLPQATRLKKVIKVAETS